jgi:hypothetical protein
MSEARVTYLTDATTDEPADQLSARDIEVLRSALWLYYVELQECGEDNHKLHRIAALSRRLADVSVTWRGER